MSKRLIHDEDDETDFDTLDTVEVGGSNRKSNKSTKNELSNNYTPVAAAASHDPHHIVRPCPHCCIVCFNIIVLFH